MIQKKQKKQKQTKKQTKINAQKPFIYEDYLDSERSWFIHGGLDDIDDSTLWCSNKLMMATGNKKEYHPV